MPKYRKPQGRSVRPTFFVFCEGETEEEYVSFLRSHFRVPIEIDASVTGLGLTKEHIERYKRGKTTMAKDRAFQNAEAVRKAEASLWTQTRSG